MKILLTGGSGFIGKNILESSLATEHTFFAPRHAELDLMDDRAVSEFFQSHEIDIVIHGAVKPGHRNAQDPSQQLYHNTRMFFNLARNSSHYKKMIYLGSGLVYDLRNYVHRMKESYYDVHVPVDEGGFSKYIISSYIQQVDKIVELRIFGIFGKYEDYAIRFISNAICKTLFDLPITIRQNRLFDYISVDDLMPVIDYFIHHQGRYKSYNITPDESVELKQLAQTVRAVSGKDLPIRIALDGMGMEYTGDNSRLRQEIPKLKFTAHEDAIRRLSDWYKENIHLIDRESLLVDK
jgi:UDP-glucose 4-epimerase